MLRRSFLVSVPSALVAAQFEGNGSAAVTIEVYADYSCPHCREYHMQSVVPLYNEYVKAGKVQLVARDYILGNFPHSKEAARYANAAAVVKKFHEVSDLLWEKQSDWSGNGNLEGVLSQTLNAAEMEQVRRASKDPKIEAQIDADTAQGKKNGISQTPTTVFIHKQHPVQLSGVLSYGVVKRYIESLF